MIVSADCWRSSMSGRVFGRVVEPVHVLHRRKFQDDEPPDVPLALQGSKFAAPHQILAAVLLHHRRDLLAVFGESIGIGNFDLRNNVGRHEALFSL